jgi:hypothetical protein
VLDVIPTLAAQPRGQMKEHASMKKEINVIHVLYGMVGNMMDMFLGRGGSKEAYVQNCQTRAQLYRQLAKHCNEYADDCEDRVNEVAAPSLHLTAEEPKAEALPTDE